MKCTLIIGRKRESWRNPEKEKTFDGEFERTNLVLTSVDDAKQIAEIAKVDCYRVMGFNKYNDYNYSDAPLYETPDITAYYSKAKDEAEAYDALQEKRCKIINAWPERFVVNNWNIPGLGIELVRTNYEYNKSHSSQIQGYVRFETKANGKQNRRNFYPKDYITKGGNVQLKKFKTEFYWEFGIKDEDMLVNFDYKGFLLSLKKAKNDLEHKIRTVN